MNIYHCTEEDNCPEDKIKLIREKRECVDNCLKDNIYEYENNNTFYRIDSNLILNISDFFNKFTTSNLSDVSKADEIMNNLRDNLKNGSMNYLISNIIDGDKEDLVIKDDNLLYQISSSEN